MMMCWVQIQTFPASLAQVAGYGLFISNASLSVQFNRFDRPDLRKSLFNKFLRNRPGLKKPGDQEDEDSAGKDDQDQDEEQDYDNENTGNITGITIETGY